MNLIRKLRGKKKNETFEEEKVENPMCVCSGLFWWGRFCAKGGTFYLFFINK